MSVQRIRSSSTVANSTNDPMSSLEAWKSMLDDMEQRLESGEAFIDSMRAASHKEQDNAGAGKEHAEETVGEQEIPDFSFTPPSEIGPIPAELLDRARQVLQRQHDLEAATQSAMNTARKHSDAAKAMRPSSPSVPVYFDGSL